MVSLNSPFFTCLLWCKQNLSLHPRDLFFKLLWILGHFSGLMAFSGLCSTLSCSIFDWVASQLWGYLDSPSLINHKLLAILLRRTPLGRVIVTYKVPTLIIFPINSSNFFGLMTLTLLLMICLHLSCVIFLLTFLIMLGGLLGRSLAIKLVNFSSATLIFGSQWRNGPTQGVLFCLIVLLLPLRLVFSLICSSI